MFILFFCGKECEIFPETKRPKNIINNAALTPPYKSDVEVKMEGMSPDWVKTLIMAEFRIETATPEGTFASATKVLNHYAEMGVNGLWINPIYERGSKGNGYGNYGPNTIEPLLTGTSITEESFAVVKNFVSEAHQKNIRIIFDIVVWGTTKQSPLVVAHPEFYKHNPDGSFVGAWGGWGFDWNSSALKLWFKNEAVNFILKTGADGFRVDLAPDQSGYFFKEVRDALYAKGRKIIVVSEIENERLNTFDFEQVGVTGWTEEPNYNNKEKFEEQKIRYGKHNDYLFKTDVNIIDVVRSGIGIGKATLQGQGNGGMFRFYTANMLHHDDENTFVKGDRIRFAYTLFAPYIPMWWIGEEWNNPRNLLQNGVIFFNKIDWTKRDTGDGAIFFEDVKRFIRIRRMFPDIFENFTDNARNANITKIDTRLNDGHNPLQAYARLGKEQAILIVPNPQPSIGTVEVRIPLQTLFSRASSSCVITDLLNGNTLTGVQREGYKSLTVVLSGRSLGLYLVKLR